MEKVCEMCGGPINSKYKKAKYCDDCRAKIHANAWKVSLAKSQDKKENEILYQPKKIPYSGPSVQEINKRAEELGMTYGKYVMKYGSRIV